MNSFECFSVLLSVYHKERSAYLNCAFESIFDKQTKKPSQIVVVKDGPLTPDLDCAIEHWKKKLGDVVTVVTLARNVGLAQALNEGIKYCKYELVARMDTDDMAAPRRFEQQVCFMLSNPDVAVSSGCIEEWDQDFSVKLSERHVPLDHESIVQFSKKRSPMNHPAVIFRKSAVVEAGGYPTIYPEDYPLWGTMLTQGHKFANLPEVLLKMRVGNALLERRGKEFLKGEIEVFKHLYAVGLINSYELVRNIALRSLVRLSPVFVKVKLYKYFR